MHGQDLKEVPFLLVLTCELAAVCYALAAPQHWLRAVGGITIGLALAGVFRLALSNEQAGLLRVRRRAFDVACYWGFGLLAVVFALSLPQR
ncbi:DUF3017 domain-containing protein [Jatrophihabitans telluris]|uniref:DUF3017 domain-containing protein n=1 Tax=Jatrophihabitans telluris TaxID=2038343 RepID=A0ABY4QWE0_9ACTN|nr:DUF3017 domain-containing protein [Jatrophihabitans telluris]UQX87845.1 DUF3017 domain-containing protein [Jatrophihabitans telluris]